MRSWITEVTDTKLKTLDKNGNLTLRDYSEETCRRIFEEKNAYVLRCVRSFGSDHGGSQCTEKTEESYMEIVPERILVRQGHFCGVSMIVDYDCYNGGGERRMQEVCLLADGSGSARDGSSFSSDDHDRWDYTDYYLVKRPAE